ncbi:MAG: hypothetical protein JST39_01635, partial [Bacteroidetes bacterium]|nr:hypothetical protein [Bacteroidota bacterium]
MLKSLLYKSRELLTRFYDPVTPLAIGSCTIKAPLSHPLRRILDDLPQFGFNITRLARYIHQQYPDCPVIDIGANIGDTAAFINNYRDLPVLCIDGDPTYFGLLQANTRQFANTRVCRALVGETNE